MGEVVFVHPGTVVEGAQWFKSLHLTSEKKNVRKQIESALRRVDRCSPFAPQVGIVAVNLLGDKLGKLAPGALDAPPAPYGAGPRSIPAYPLGNDGRAGGVGVSRPGLAELNDLSFDMNFDPEAAERIRDIAAAKERAVRSEVGGGVLISCMAVFV